MMDITKIIDIRILVFILLILILVYYFSAKKSEGFYSGGGGEEILNGSGINTGGDALLLKDEYPLTGRKRLSAHNTSKYWWKYPELPLKYSQVTNNLKYYKNPDIGTNSFPEFNGVFYGDKHAPKNTIDCIKTEVPDEEGKVRVGFFNTSLDLLY